MISIKVPTVGESITEVTLLKWTNPEGAYVDRDEVIAKLAQHGLTAANENGAGQIVAAGTLEQLAALETDPPAGALGHGLRHSGQRDPVLQPEPRSASPRLHGNGGDLRRASPERIDRAGQGAIAGRGRTDQRIAGLPVRDDSIKKRQNERSTRHAR